MLFIAFLFDFKSISYDYNTSHYIEAFTIADCIVCYIGLMMEIGLLGSAILKNNIRDKEAREEGIKKREKEEKRFFCKLAVVN